MQEQSAAVQYFLPFTIAMIMLAMGLGLTVDDFKRILEKPKAVLIGLTSQIVLLPILGFGIAYGFGLVPELAVGVILLTACPGGAHSNLYADLSRGDVALSVTLTAVSGFITIVTIPPLVQLATSVFATSGEVVQLPVWRTMMHIFLLMGVPVVLGMFVRAKSEVWADRLKGGVKGFAVVLLALIVVGSIARQSDNVAAFAKQAGIPVLTLNLVAMLGGFLMARGGGLPGPQQRTITLEVGIQNGALAFALAAGLLESTAIAVPAILYSILVYFTGLIVIAWGRAAAASEIGKA